MPESKVSTRLQTVPVSSVRKLTSYAKQAKKEGVKIYHLNIGDPDIKTPQVMLDALQDFANNPIRYADSQGELPFRKALTEYYHKFAGKFVEEADILVTQGGSEAIEMAFFATCQTGDEVLVFEPFYSAYSVMASLTDIKLVGVPSSSIESGFHLPERAVIESKITDRTKAILICTPSNPTGTIYTKEEMDLLVDIVKKHNLFLLSDEVYREFAYDEVQQVSLLSYMEEIPEQAILLDSLSKRYSLCGARLGVLLTQNKDVINGCLKLAQGRLSAGLIEQVMATKLTEIPESYTKDVVSEYRKRRDILYEGLSEIPGVTFSRPEGAFYTMVSLPVDNAEKFCIFLLEKFRLNNETLMLAPGSGFYQTKGLGDREVRIAYVLNEEDLKKSIEIIRLGLVEYNGRSAGN